jgi:hypothetical protein
MVSSAIQTAIQLFTRPPKLTQVRSLRIDADGSYHTMWARDVPSPIGMICSLCTHSC